MYLTDSSTASITSSTFESHTATQNVSLFPSLFSASFLKSRPLHYSFYSIIIITAQIGFFGREGLTLCFSTPSFVGYTSLASGH